MITLEAWIKVNFGSQKGMEEDLGLAKKTINRWSNSNPARFYSILPQLMERTGTEAVDIIKMVKQREVDVMAIEGKR